MSDNIIKDKVSNWIEQEVDEALTSNYMPYAMMVIISRALPLVYDGLKPSHRKLLFTMYKMDLLKQDRTKSANIVGQTMKLNPHGDAAIYETMVRLTTDNQSLLLPFVDSKGNFGKVYSRDMAYAASRYTEAKLHKVAKELFNNIDNDIVDFKDNYDGKMKEPIVLPATFPVILANPTQGIAVGMASSICSFNLNELCDGTIELLDNEDYDLMLAPDFSTGGEYLYDASEIKQVMDTGKGKFIIRAEYEYIKEYNCIEINSIPYTTTVEAIIDKICDLIKEGKIKEITDVRDETDLSGLKITLDLKRGINVEQLMQKLYRMTTLKDTFSCNFNVLVNDAQGNVFPKVIGAKEIIKEWAGFRVNTIKREIAHDLEAISKKLHVLEGFKVVLLDIDKAISLIRSSKTEKEAYQKLEDGFNLTHEQAESVGSIRLIKLNEDYLINKIKEYDDLLAQQDKLNKMLNSDSLIKKRIKKELEQIKKQYGKERLTQVVKGAKDSDVVNVVEEEPCYLILTKENYIKLNTDHHLTQRAQQKVKDGDEVVVATSTTTFSTLLLFTDQANCYKVYLTDIPFTTPSTLGTFLPTLAGLGSKESITHIQLVEKDFKGYMLNIYESNHINKVPMETFKTETKRSCLKNTFSTSEKLVAQYVVEEDVDLFIQSPMGKAYIVNTGRFEARNTKNAIGDLVVPYEPNFKIQSALCMNNLTEEAAAFCEEHREMVPMTGDIRQLAYEYSVVLTKKNRLKVCKGYSNKHKLDKDDSVVANIDGNKVKSILVFTTQGHCQVFYPSQFELSDFGDRGIKLESLLEVDPWQDKEVGIVGVQLVTVDKGVILNVFENNQLAKTSLEHFILEDQKSVIKNAISVESPLKYQVILAEGEDKDLFIKAPMGKAYVVNTAKVEPKPTKNNVGELAIAAEPNFIIEQVVEFDSMEGIASVENGTYKLPIRTPESPVEEVVPSMYSIALTQNNYVKVYSGEVKEVTLEEGDCLVVNQSAENICSILVFTSMGNAYPLNITQFELSDPNGKGQALVDMISLGEGEEILTVQFVEDDFEGFVLSIFENNRIAKVNLSSYKTEIKNTVLRNSLCVESAPLVAQYVLKQDEDFFVETVSGLAYRVNTHQFNAKATRSISGELFVKINSECVLKSIKRYKDVLETDQFKKRFIVSEEAVHVDSVELLEQKCYVSVTNNFEFKMMNESSINESQITEDVKEYEVTNKGAVLVFTSLENCYKVYLSEQSFMTADSKMISLKEILDLEEGEEIISTQVANASYSGWLINIYEHNKLAKVELASFKTESNRSCLKNSLAKDSVLINQFIINEDIDLFVESTNGRVLIVNTEMFNPKASKSTAGDMLIKVKNDSKVKRSYPLAELDLTEVEDVNVYRGNRGATGFEMIGNDSFFPEEEPNRQKVTQLKF